MSIIQPIDIYIASAIGGVIIGISVTIGNIITEILIKPKLVRFLKNMSKKIDKHKKDIKTHIIKVIKK